MKAKMKTTNGKEQTIVSSSPASAGSAICSECGWTNVNLLNLGEPGSPRMVCHGCLKRALEAVDAYRAAKAARQAAIEYAIAKARDNAGKFVSDESMNAFIEELRK